MPGSAVGQIVQLLQQLKPTILTVAFNERQAMFVSDSFSILTQLFNGNYPDLGSYLANAGKSALSKIVLETDVLNRIIRTAMVYESDIHTPIEFECEQNMLRVFVQSRELGEYEETIPVEHAGEKFVISLNISHLQNILRVNNSDLIALVKYEKGVSPVYVYPDSINSFCYWVTMPLIRGWK